MKIVIGSANVPKREAVIEAFRRAHKDQHIDANYVTTDSAVSSHPTSATEAMQGALNRVADARRQVQEADYYVGIEGGLLQSDGRAWEIGWVAISNSEGSVATGLSAGIELQGTILKAVQEGIELNDVLEDIYGTKGVGNANGYNGLATNDLVTRQQAYVQGVLFALAQFLHPELYR